MGNFSRIGIYFFYDKDGIVDDYISYLLNDLKKNLSYLLVICNGKLTCEGRNIFNQYADEVIVRENIGLDVWAYKTAFEYIGWDALEKYDETVIANSTIMGPVYPFQAMFDAMELRDVDFWGITKHNTLTFDPFNCNPYGYIPEHIQSHFMVFRRKLISCLEFKLYWDNMEMINSYEESIGKFESSFTKFFSDKGFQWDTYVNPVELDELCEFPLLFYPKQMIDIYKCPIFKRRSFFQEYDYLLSRTTGQSTYELYSYLKNHSTYNINLIWNNILRTCNQEDIVRAMHLNYILSTQSEKTDEIEKILKKRKIALVMHLYFMDLLDLLYHYASSMPEEADIYITTNTVEKKNIIIKKFASLPCSKLEVRVIENRGRDVSSILVGVKDIIQNYDYVCFAHDKKSKQIIPASVGEGFAYKCLENILKNKIFVNNILYTFEENPRLGILSPPVPNHADYYPILGCEWSGNFQRTKELAEQLEIKIPIDNNKVPIAPYGTCFWFRPAAFRVLYDYDWKYSDFPQEPNNTDNTILHAVERIYPYAVQQAGYYPAIIMADTFASIEYSNLQYYTRQVTRVVSKYSLCNYEPKMIFTIERAISQYQYLKEQNDIDNLRKVLEIQEENLRRVTEEYSQCQRQNFFLLNELRCCKEQLNVDSSLRQKIRHKLKSILPRPFFGFIIRAKRFLVGPHGVEYRYDE